MLRANILQVAVLVLVVAVRPSLGGDGAGTPDSKPTRELTLHDFLQMVLARNESIQVRAIELGISQKKLSGERGIFEPELLLRYDHVENKRENTAEQRRSTGALFFEENNNLYTSGLEMLIPTGAKIRLGYTLNELRNNLQSPPLGVITPYQPGAEFQSFAGINLSQPLLKNAWFPATLANIRLAALAGDVAYQEYRRQMMLVITTAEAAYWNLYLAQEQVRFFRDSAQLAEGLVHDNAARLEAGKGSELEVSQATAGLALRRTKLAEAEQKYLDTAAQMSTLVAEALSEATPLFRATSAPGQPRPAPQFDESAKVALEMNPDYLGQVKRLQQDDVRLAYAKNQRLPQLDLKASYGLNGLGSDPQSSWSEIEHGGFPAWTVGVELHLPLGGGIQVKNELAAVKLRKRQGLVSLKEMENQILNAVTTSLRKISSAQDNVRDYEQIAAFNQSLLETELQRQAVGKVDVQRVLDVEAALFDAKNSVVEAKVRYERARLEFELAQGIVLSSRTLDLPRQEIEQRTTRQLKGAGISEQQFRNWLKAPPLTLGGSGQADAPSGRPSTAWSSSPAAAAAAPNR
jgi:outer membrane protein TolC